MAQDEFLEDDLDDQKTVEYIKKRESIKYTFNQ